ncbi:integrase [Sphingobium sp. B2D3A]|uniref:hypothetical protein n=1 Tax=unclassified Sphingobium TaxID=2611147 RepID=UPI00222405C4|nr:MULTISPECIES: hypothetical protein [unclassified Sphingobium]MCW2336961.1 integrase [Sphingobium sp. B2D3A]MCW2386714.1 integrase [Sphingobium sp. B2D3D]
MLKGVKGSEHFRPRQLEYGAIVKRLASADFCANSCLLKPDLIEKRWGDKPIAVWDDFRMVAKVMKWRDERASTPRAADVGVTVLRELLKFGRLHGRARINVAESIPHLYKGGNRADIIWTADDMEAFKRAALELKKPLLYDGLRLAALTGLRRADLVSLTWDHLGEVATSRPP